MRKTLEALYYDNLCISARTLNKDGEYYKSEQAVSEAADELEKTFTPQQREIWERYNSLIINSSDLGCLENFILGFRTATRLLMEALGDNSDDETFPIKG